MKYLLPFLYATLATFGFAIVFEVKKPKFLLFSSLIGGLGWLMFLLLEGHVAPVFQYLYATIFVSAMSEITARIWKAPATIFLLPGIIPLVPGGGLYYCMSYLLDGDYTLFAQKGLQTTAYAGAIAAGVSIVTSLVRVIFWKRMTIEEQTKQISHTSTHNKM